MSTNRRESSHQPRARCGGWAVAWMLVVTTAACGSTNEEVVADASLPTVDAMQEDRWSTFAADFIEVYCHECHGPGDSLRDYSLLTTVTSERDKIRCGVSPSALSGCTISARQFPVGSGPKPTDEDRMRLVEWIDRGAPE